MLHRLTNQGLICITQPKHAWLSGQLAEAWGNEHFTHFAPRAEVCLGAEQHDIGWLLWEQAPTLNPQTGHPYKFTELPTQVHIGIWSDAKKLALCLGQYVTLLVSLHGTGLYERFTSWQNSQTSTEIVQGFLNQEYAFQEQLVTEEQAKAPDFRHGDVGGGGFNFGSDISKHFLMLRTMLF
ncbi:hypothetical protein NUACC21_54940 [Scytonema sp. NUACC21]